MRTVASLSALALLLPLRGAEAFSSTSSSSFAPRGAGHHRHVRSGLGIRGGVFLDRPSRPTTTRLDMMFDSLSSALTEAASAFGGKQRMTEASVAPALKSVRRALLDADVNLEVANALIDGVRRRSLGQEVTKGVTAEQQFIKAMYDELLELMGGDPSTSGGMGGAPSLQSPTATLAYRDGEKPTVILLAGLQGAGKTTAAGKLALYLKEREVDASAVESMSEEERSNTLSSRLPKRNRKVLLVAADVYRPAAIEQLQILGTKVEVEVFSMGADVDPADIATEALKKATQEGHDTVLVDTAGRQAVDEELMEELRRVKAAGEFIYLWSMGVRRLAAVIWREEEW
ncbi:hypothetical protein ACHAWF_011910 [Thalassiosira exigua]